MKNIEYINKKIIFNNLKNRLDNFLLFRYLDQTDKNIYSYWKCIDDKHTYLYIGKNKKYYFFIDEWTLLNNPINIVTLRISIDIKLDNVKYVTDESPLYLNVFKEKIIPLKYEKKVTLIYE